MPGIYDLDNNYIDEQNLNYIINLQKYTCNLLMKYNNLKYKYKILKNKKKLIYE